MDGLVLGMFVVVVFVIGYYIGNQFPWKKK